MESALDSHTKLGLQVYLFEAGKVLLQSLNREHKLSLRASSAVYPSHSPVHHPLAAGRCCYKALKKRELGEGKSIGSRSGPTPTPQ